MDKVTKAAVERMENARQVGCLNFPKFIQVSVEDRDLIVKALKKKGKQEKSNESDDADEGMEFTAKRSVPDVVGKEPT